MNEKTAAARNALQQPFYFNIKYYRKNIKVAVAPLVIMSLLFILVPSLTSSTSFMIIPSGAIAIGIALLLYKKENKGEEH